MPKHASQTIKTTKKKIKEDLRKPPTSLLHKRNPLTLKNSSITITTKTCPQLLVIHHMYKISSNLEARRTNPQNPPPSPTHNSPNKHNHSIIRKASLRHQPNANRRSYLNTAPRTLWGRQTPPPDSKTKLPHNITLRQPRGPRLRT